jgi:hypothetical protein
MRSLSLLALSTGTLLVSGCLTPSAQLTVSRAELARGQTALLREETALLRQYRECLQRAETNSEVDCSGYRTAVEINDAREPK